MSFHIKTDVMLTEQHELNLTGLEIADLLCRAGINVPQDAKITFTVPRGGDYCGTIIEIDKATPVKVRWTVTTKGLPDEGKS